MNNSTPKNLNTSNNSNSSSINNVRPSYLRPPQLETKVPSFLQQTRVSLYIPKHDNELPDYTNSPITIAEDQHTVRSLAQISGLATFEGSAHSSANKAVGLIRKDTLYKKQASLAIVPRGNSSAPEIIDVFSDTKNVRKKKKKFQKINKFLDNRWFNLLLTVMTIFALFGQDFGALVAPNKYQPIFDSLILVGIATFVVELMLSFIVRPEYRWTFFFYLDVISTLSMILDLSFIHSDFIDSQ